jgi:hypothetical protein
MKKIASTLALALLLAASGTQAAINTLDNVPAATLLLPHFDIDPASASQSTVVTVGNALPAEVVAHVTLWTDRGVPTRSFDIRLPGYGTNRFDLNDVFVDGTLPQSTAGGFGTCGATLPPAALSAGQAADLRAAHTGQSSTLLGNMCGSTPQADGHARGYATIDVVSGCTTAVPGDAGYFVDGGGGIAQNTNALWGEYSVRDSASGQASGEALVAIEASASNLGTDGTPVDGINDYTFYGRLVGGTGADNREALAQTWHGRYSLEDLIFRTTAIVWRDPGDVAPFACNSTPAGIRLAEVVAFNQQEEVSLDRELMALSRASQAIDLSDPGQSAVPFGSGFLVYNLGLGTSSAPFEARNQGYVSHRYQSIVGSTEQATTWPLNPMFNGPNFLLLGPPPQCDDGIDNDGDGDVDFPADDGCTSEETFLEAPECSDGVDNDGDTFVDFPTDTQCVSRADRAEVSTEQCDDGIDNDGDGLIDAFEDPNCNSPFDDIEATGLCSDGIDNDGDGQTDFPDDLGCFSVTDNDETNSVCADGIDNDSDTFTDFPNDVGCNNAFDNDEANAACADGIDNDGDTFIDFPNDPGCETPQSNIESPGCNDTMDNDGDMLIDFPNDPGCAAAFSNNEQPACSNGFDDDGDGFTDFPLDVGCTAASDTNEGSASQCDDGIDNDADGIIDFPLEPGCAFATDTFEGPDCNDLGDDNDIDGTADFGNDPGCASLVDLNELAGALTRACADGLDNDGDGATDYPTDAGCLSAWDDVEFVPQGVAPVIVVNPATLPDANGGVIYNQMLSATGGTGPYTFLVTSGTLPAGLTLTGAGVLSGTPTAAGSFNFTVEATDANSFTGTRDYTLVVIAPTIVLQPASLPAADGGVAYSQTFTASGGTAPYSFALSAGALPTGLALAANGQLTGTPMQGGSFNFTVQATDANGFTGTAPYTLVVNAPVIVVSPAALPPMQIGLPFSQQLTAAGGVGPYTFALTAGAFPTGVTLSADGLISGTPLQPGTFNVTVTATDANGFTGTVNYGFVLGPPPITGAIIIPSMSPSGLLLLFGLFALVAIGALRRR